MQKTLVAEAVKQLPSELIASRMLQRTNIEYFCCCRGKKLMYLRVLSVSHLKFLSVHQFCKSNALNPALSLLI